jgi:hypothetical protein
MTDKDKFPQVASSLTSADFSDVAKDMMEHDRTTLQIYIGSRRRGVKLLREQMKKQYPGIPIVEVE